MGWEAQLEEKCIKHSNQSVDETSGITIFNILQEENKKLKEENEKVNNDLFERTSFESYFLQNEEDKDFIDYIEFLEFRKDDEKECLDRATERYKSLMITLKENRKLKEELKLKDETITITKWDGTKLTIQELEEAYILMSQTKEVFRKNFEELKIQIKKGVAGDELNDLIKELDKEVDTIIEDYSKWN